MSDKNKSRKSIREVSTNKKAAVLGVNKRKNKFLSYGALSVMAVVIIAAVVAFQQIVLTSEGSGSAKIAETQVKDGHQREWVTHPINLFDDGMAKHFQFRTDTGITVRYFVLKSSDGVVRAAFDACDVCWPSGKGYYQEQDSMVCRNCGRRFASVQINEVKGGCNPAPLNRKIEEGNLVIAVADILKGISYFDFKGRTRS